jgi:hypothetical protein
MIRGPDSPAARAALAVERWNVEMLRDRSHLAPLFITGNKAFGGRRIEISTSRLLNLTLNRGLHELKNCCVIVENKGNNRVEMPTDVPSGV